MDTRPRLPATPPIRGAASWFSERLHLASICALVVFSLGSTYYFHFIRHTDIVYSHIFYVPIVMAGVWWGRKAVLVSAVLAANLILSNVLSGVHFALHNDLFRALMFIIVGTVLGLMVEQKNRLQAQALREHQRNLDQMSEHLRFVERVSHELRNPLQVSLSVLDSLDTGPLPEEQKTLLGLLNRSTEQIRTRITELTPDD